MAVATAVKTPRNTPSFWPQYLGKGPQWSEEYGGKIGYSVLSFLLPLCPDSSSSYMELIKFLNTRVSEIDIFKVTFTTAQKYEIFRYKSNKIFADLYAKNYNTDERNQRRPK